MGHDRAQPCHWHWQLVEPSRSAAHAGVDVGESLKHVPEVMRLWAAKIKLGAFVSGDSSKIVPVAQLVASLRRIQNAVGAPTVPSDLGP